MSVDDPWLVVHGDQVGGDWVSITRDEMQVLWRRVESLEGINDYLSGRLCEGSYCRVRERFSEIDLI